MLIQRLRAFKLCCDTNATFFFVLQKLQEYFPIAEIGQLQEDSSNILSILGNAFDVKQNSKCLNHFT